jgi:predicted DCC family thiol-disulfide oxidoreductase YuxK
MEQRRQPPHPILLYDGVCGFCNRTVQFVLRRDRAAIFRFAALQSPFAARVLARHGTNPADLDTFYVVLNYESGENTARHEVQESEVRESETHESKADESLLSRSDAIVFTLGELGGPWRFAATMLSLVPRFLRDWGYNLVARTRYRIFGRYDSCPLPSPDTRSRFLDH